MQIILGVIGVVILTGVILFALIAPSTSDACKNARGHTYTAIISGSQVSLGSLNAKQCDKLTIINNDKVTREIAFGPHNDHVPYDGVAEKILNQNQSFTITLNTTGTYRWHDHLHDKVQGYFTVNK